jgi:type I restriction enzyme R subunit
MSIHTERTFEEAIEHSLLTHGGYHEAPRDAFDADMALLPSVLVGFLQETQPEKWARLAEQYGDDVQRQVVATVARAADQFGLLHVLRNGVTDRGIKLELAFFKPASGLNQETLRLYRLNRLTISRQVHHSARDPVQSVDVVLALNGLRWRPPSSRTRSPGRPTPTRSSSTRIATRAHRCSDSGAGLWCISR